MSPIRPDRKALYPPDWPAISRRVKLAAGWRCQKCGVKHGAQNPRTGATVVLTTHHKDFDPTNCRRRNLIALCQLCHNQADARHRAETRAATASMKRVALVASEAQGPLFKAEAIA